MNDAYYYALAATHKKKKKHHKSTSWMSPPHVSKKHRRAADKRATHILHHDLQSFNKSIAHNPNVTDFRIHRGKKNIVRHPLGIDPHTVALVNQRNKELEEEQQHLLSRQHTIAVPKHLNVGVKAKLGPGAGPLLTQPHVYHPPHHFQHSSHDPFAPPTSQHGIHMPINREFSDAEKKRQAQQAIDASKKFGSIISGPHESIDTQHGILGSTFTPNEDEHPLTPIKDLTMSDETMRRLNAANTPGGIGSSPSIGPLHTTDTPTSDPLLTEEGEPHTGYAHSYFSKDNSSLFLAAVAALLVVGGYYVFIDKHKK